MAEKHIDTSDIYDNPAQHMTFAGVFMYAGVDLIPLRIVTTERGRYEHHDNDLHEMRCLGCDTQLLQ